jgi:hypothetical protein
MESKTTTSNVETALELRGRRIREDDNGLVCLNDIWQAAGYTKSKRPYDWMRAKPVHKMIDEVVRRNTGKSRNWTKKDLDTAYYTKRGDDGGTYADPRLALAYAEFLNPKLAVEVREVFLRYKRADATLADDILDRSGPEANEWAARRALSRSVRNKYTATLSDHGVDKRIDFAKCTNELYISLFDKPAKQLAHSKGIRGNLRDNMDSHDLTAVMFAESLSSKRIEEQKSDGPLECRLATGRSARFVRQAIDADREDKKNSGAR